MVDYLRFNGRGSFGSNEPNAPSVCSSNAQGRTVASVSMTASLFMLFTPVRSVRLMMSPYYVVMRNATHWSILET